MTRLDRLRDQMKREAVDLVVLAPGAHMLWLTGLAPHGDERPLLLGVSLTGAGFVMPALEAESARRGTDLPFVTWTDTEGPDAALDQLLSDLGAGDAGVVVLDECMRADHAALVTDRLPRATRRFTASTIGALRMRKEAGEYKLLKQNALAADHAMQAAWAAMTPGMTETAVAQVVRDSFAASGAQPLFAIVGTGANGAMPHHQTGDSALATGDSVVMDIGGRIAGYSSDITRMAVLGSPSEDYLSVHAVVEEAVQAALAAARPGVPASHVDLAARQVIADAGYAEAFLHRTGHGLGSEVHEPPYITGASDTILDEGMVFSIEPGIYLPGRFGIRLEDIVILRADGPEILSDLPRDLKVIA